MPIFKIKATRVAAEEAVVYVYADTLEQAREDVRPDLNDIIEAHSAWDLDDFACEEAEIASVTEVEKLPRLWTIPDELDFRAAKTKEEEPEPPPEDPRQTKLDFTR